MSLLMDFTFLAAGVNVAVLAGLLYPSAKNLVRTRSSITIGLLLFISVFLIHNVTLIYFHLTMMSFYTLSVEPLVLGLTLMQSFSFATLLWVSYK